MFFRYCNLVDHGINWTYLVSLLYLDIGNNHLKNISSILNQVGSLRTLDAFNNALSEIDTYRSWAGKTLTPSRLVSIVLSGNRFQHFPSDLLTKQFPELISIILVGNKITTEGLSTIYNLPKFNDPLSDDIVREIHLQMNCITHIR